MNFARKWNDKEKQSLNEMIGKIRSNRSFKSRLDDANKRMNAQIKKLDTAERRISERDKSLFAKTVKAYAKHDVVRAKVYANELAEIRKTKNQITDTKLALEQVSLRLGTVSDFGDVVSVLSPSVNILQNVGKGMSTTLPEAGKELGTISNLLNEIIFEFTPNNQMDIGFEAPNDAAKNILAEAAQEVETSIKQKLPETPIETPVPEKVLTNT